MRAGEAAAYGELVIAHAAMAKRLAVLSGAGDDADDVVQEAFVKAYTGLEKFRDGAPFRPWLLRIVVNETRNRHRGETRREAREERVTSLDLPLAASDDPADAAALAERRTALLAAVRSLPDPFRDTVVCRYLLELSEAETAATLGVAPGTVKSRLSRALGLLRTELADG